MFFKEPTAVSSKKESLVLNCITFILLNVAFFICNPFPKHIIELNGWESIVAAISNALFCLVYFMFLFIAVRKKTHFFSADFSLIFEPFVKKSGFLWAILFLVIQSAFDALRLMLSFFLPKWEYFFGDIIIVLSWLLFYFLLANKDENLFKKPKFAVPTVLIILMLFSAAIIFDFYIVTEQTYITMKYETGSNSLKNGLATINFGYEVKAFLLDTLLGLVIIILHALYTKEAVAERKSTPSNARTSFFRIIGILVLLYIYLFPVTVISPSGVLYETSFSGGDDPSNRSGSFYAEVRVFSATRLDCQNEPETVCEITNNKVFYADKKVLRYYSFDSLNATKILKDVDIPNMIVVEDRFEEISVKDSKVQIFKNQVICFTEGEEVKAIYLEGKNIPEKNEILSETFRVLLSNGNASIFEYCSSYLTKHDYEFISPYIERYKNGNFTEAELQNLNENGIRKEFIVSIANQIET